MELLDEVTSFLNRTGMKPTRLGREAINDPHLVRKLQERANMTLRTIDRVRAFMASYAAPAEAEAQRAA